MAGSCWVPVRTAPRPMNTTARESRVIRFRVSTKLWSVQLGLCLSRTRCQPPLAKQTLRAHDVQDEDLVPIVAIEDATRWLHNLPVPRPPKFLWAAAALWMISELLDMTKDALDQFRCSDWILQCDVIGNGIQVAQRRL